MLLLYSTPPRPALPSLPYSRVQAANCLMDQRGGIKLADFGMSKRMVVRKNERAALVTE